MQSVCPDASLASSVLDTLSQQSGGDALTHISRQIGAGETQTQQAVGAALTALLGALAQA